MEWIHLIGHTLGEDGRYEILAELGRGASSHIYRARDRIGERDVAIKVLPKDAEDRQGFVRRFEREAQAIAQLHHPNIVSVYGKGETEEVVYLVLQCVSGGTLRARLGKPLAIPEAAGAIIQMAHALHYAHQHGVIHRDVKPSNILVDGANPRRLLLTDFGIAKLQGMRGLTKSGMTIGTPEYMAPEQAAGSELDHRADVYALGCVLYEALCGRPPFVGATPVSVLYQQVHVRPPSLRAFNLRVPRDLVRVVQQALAKRPEDRFDTAQALAQALYPFTERRELSSDSGSVGPAVASVSSHTLDDETERGGKGEETATEPGQTGQPSHRWGTEGLDAIFPADAEVSAAHTIGTPAPEQPTPLHSLALPPEEGLPMPERPVLLQPTQSPVLSVSAAERDTQPSARRMGDPTPPLDMPQIPDDGLDVTAPLALVQIDQIDQTLPRLTPPQERWETGEPPEDSRHRGGGPGGRGVVPRGRKRSAFPLLLVGVALAVVVITSSVVLLIRAGDGLRETALPASPTGMLTPSSGATGLSASPSGVAATATPGAVESPPVVTPSALPSATATSTPLPPRLAIGPSLWKLSGGLFSPCSSPRDTPQTVTNVGPHAVSWAWQSSGAPSPSTDNLQYGLNGGNYVPGLPSHASLAAGGKDTLAVRMNCTGQTYTVSVLATDLVTGAHTTFTFTLQVS